MTITARRDQHDESVVEVGITYGPISIQVRESDRDVRYFHGQLGRVLDGQAHDGKTHAQIAYEAYAEHCGGKSVHGEDLPSWDDQADEIKAHWDAAADAIRRTSFVHADPVTRH